MRKSRRHHEESYFHAQNQKALARLRKAGPLESAVEKTVEVAQAPEEVRSRNLIQQFMEVVAGLYKAGAR